MRGIFVSLVILTASVFGSAKEKASIVQETVLAMKGEALCKMSGVLSRQGKVGFEDAMGATLIIVRGGHSSENIARENIDALKDNASGNAFEGIIDGLKTFEHIIHAEPGSALEAGRDAFVEFRDAWNDYDTASQLQDHLEHGRYEPTDDGRGIFVGPDYGR